jgi:peptidoglycan-associated lipoprotein
MRRTGFVALAVVVVTGVLLTGCASEKYVQQQIAASEQKTTTKISEVQTQVESSQAEIGKLHQEDTRLQGEITKLSATAQDALNRAEEAGRLAKGKFLYEVTLSDDQVKFGFNKYELSTEAKAALDAFAAKIKKDNKGVFVEVQGHTDNIGSEKVNLELGYKRAEQVMRYLSMQHGFALHRMNVISYGEFKPVADNNTADGRTKNRRVVLVVLE